MRMFAAKRVQACANLLFLHQHPLVCTSSVIKCHKPANQTICVLILNDLLLSFTLLSTSPFTHPLFTCWFVLSFTLPPMCPIIIHLTPSIPAHLTLCQSAAACFSFIFPLHPSFSISEKKSRTHCQSLLVCRRHPQAGISGYDQNRMEVTSVFLIKPKSE